jgi:pimeloyl-ACP methyl ester carboxylesterase
MNRIEFKNSRNLTLVGNLSRNSSAAAIVMAHGFTSDKSSDGRFDRLAESLNSRGFTVLAFDFSGCGESDSDILTLEHQIDDLKSAISFVKSMGQVRIGLHGHSLGGLICLRAFTPAISTMVLTGALTDSMKYEWEQFFSEKQLQDLDRDGYLITVDRTGKERRIGRKMLDGFGEIDQRALLTNVGCPVLLIHGDDPNDLEEIQLLERTRRGMKFLSSDSRLEIIGGANHGFRNHYQSVIDLTSNWFLRLIPRGGSGDR